MNQFNTGDFQMPVTVTTRIEKNLAQVIDEVAKKEGTSYPFSNAS
jgi:hypothetical protein